MPPFRAALLALTLGSAAAFGWLCQPVRPAADVTHGKRSVGHSLMDPSHSRPHYPARPQKTRPDPTPDDQGQPSSASWDFEEPGSVVQSALTLGATCWLIDSPSPSWSEPVRHAPLLQITHRFRF